MKHDAVNHPAHYTDGKNEVIDFIEDKRLGYHLGNVVKYVCRAGKKDPSKEIEDLRKAAWYLIRHIEYLKEEIQKNENTDPENHTGRKAQTGRIQSPEKTETRR